MQNSIFNNKIPLSYPNENLEGIRFFFRGYFSTSDKYYTVKHYSNHLILAEERQTSLPRLQTFLKRLFLITLLAPLIGLAWKKYTEWQLSERKIFVHTPYPAKSLESVNQAIRDFPEARLPRMTLSHALKDQFEKCTSHQEIAGLIETVGNNKTLIINDFLRQRGFFENVRPSLSSDIDVLIQEYRNQLKRMAFETPEEMSEFLLTIQTFDKKISIVDEDFKTELLQKTLAMIEQTDPIEMAALMELIQHDYGQEFVRDILLAQIEPGFNSLSQIEHLEHIFISPHQDLLGIVKARNMLVTLNSTIQSPDLHLPSFKEELEKVSRLLPLSFSNSQKEEFPYEILKEMVDSLKYLPTNATLDLPSLTKFQEVYNSLADKFQIGHMVIETINEYDDDLANELQEEEWLS